MMFGHEGGHDSGSGLEEVLFSSHQSPSHSAFKHISSTYQALELIIVPRSDVCAKVLDVILADAVQLVVRPVVLRNLTSRGGRALSDEAEIEGDSLEKDRRTRDSTNVD